MLPLQHMGIIPFQLDTAPPHPGVRVEDDVAVKDVNGGWVTLQATKAISPGNHQWGLKILDQGDGSDGSGLMVGLLPKLSQTALPCTGSKYLSELGGWCISRAGQVYGPWKCDRLTFGTGHVLEFNVDMAREVVTITSGKERVTGFISGLRDSEIYPAVSLYYINQKVMFV